MFRPSDSSNMKHWNFSGLSLFLFILSHLALIPILSSFGLNICPLLNDNGFWFGCQYSAKFVFSVLSVQLLFITSTSFLLLKITKRNYLQDTLLENTFKLFPLVSLGVHIFNFYYFSQNYQHQLSDHTPHAKEVQIFLYLCMSLIVVLGWAWLDVEAIYHSRKFIIKNKTIHQSLNRLWFVEQKNKLIPTIGLISFFIFYFSLFLEASENNEDLALTIKEQKSSFIYLAAVAVIWQTILLYFDFYKNLYFINQAENHLQQLDQQNWKHHSNLFQGGFYSFIFNLLNQLSDNMLKKTRLLRGFSAFVSESVAKDVLDQDTHVQTGTQQKVAILMADIRDFTKFSSQMKPQEVVDLLNIYFTDMLEIFIEYGVTLDKFIGDGILAYIPLTDESKTTNIENITKAAFQMHAKINQTNQKLKAKKLPKIQLGVSLHVGQVVIGSIGSKDKLQYTIIGDPVNVAARLEGFCKDHRVGIIASSHFMAKVTSDTHLKFISLGKQSIRGIEAPIEIFGALPQEQKLAVA